jgi:hypothetical protein
VSRSRTIVAFAAGIVALTLLLAACGGGDGEKTPAKATPPSASGSLPPAFLECMADQGFSIESSADIHLAPLEVLQVCFASLHEDSGTP